MTRYSARPSGRGAAARVAAWAAATVALCLGGLAASALARADGGVDTVDVGTDESRQAVVLVDGKGDGGCVNDSLVAGAGAVAVGAFTVTSSCPGEVAVFSRGAAFQLQAAPWTAGADALKATPTPPVEAPLNIVVISNRQHALEWALNDVAHANDLYDENRAGMVFHVAHDSLIPRLTVAAPGSAQDLVGDGCGQVAVLRQAGPPLYQPGQVNVYFVEYVGQAPRGYTCYTPSDGAADNVIYVSVYHHSPVTLAHELGHAFMLRGATGHADDIPGLLPADQGVCGRNVMCSIWDASEAAAMDRFTLGQVFRMNVDLGSCLNENRLRDLPGAPAIARSCSTDPHDARPCPPLSLDLPGGDR
jgi:hypothetical protein